MSDDEATMLLSSVYLLSITILNLKIHRLVPSLFFSLSLLFGTPLPLDFLPFLSSLLLSLFRFINGVFDPLFHVTTTSLSLPMHFPPLLSSLSLLVSHNFLTFALYFFFLLLAHCMISLLPYLTLGPQIERGMMDMDILNHHLTSFFSRIKLNTAFIIAWSHFPHTCLPLAISDVLEEEFLALAFKLWV